MMAFGDHLEELRRRLLFALAPIVPVFVLLFLGWQTVLSFLVGPAFEVLASSGTSAGLQLLGPAEAVMAALKLSTIGAIVLGPRGSCCNSGSSSRQVFMPGNDALFIW